ncbi:MAG: hypothetical protein HYT94_04780 [Parcubacteria group bacterium]|nr:hypothetical protein [Parcubacteria group bacterium]
MNTSEKYRDLIEVFENESWVKTFNCTPLWTDDTHAFVKMPINPEHANFSIILWGGIISALGDIAAPIIATTQIDRKREIIRLHTCDTVLLKPILFEDEALLIVAEITGQCIGTSRKGFPRKKIKVKTHTFSTKTGEEKSTHDSLYDVLPKEVDERLISRERSRISR